MNKKNVLSIFVLSVVLLLSVSMVSAFGGFRGNVSQEDRQTLQNAIESGNYDTWSKIKQKEISRENFDEIVLRHAQREDYRMAISQARELGDTETIEKLKEEFGYGKKMNMKNKNNQQCNNFN